MTWANLESVGRFHKGATRACSVFYSVPYQLGGLAGGENERSVEDVSVYTGALHVRDIWGGVYTDRRYADGFLLVGTAQYYCVVMCCAVWIRIYILLQYCCWLLFYSVHPDIVLFQFERISRCRLVGPGGYVV